MIRNGHWVGAALILVTVEAGAQTPLLPPVLTNSTPSVSKMNHSSAVDSTAEELVLTGVVNIGPLKRAFLKIERRGEPVHYRTLEERGVVDDIETIAIDTARARVTLRYRGKIREVALNQVRGPSASQAALEKERDLTHTRHHTYRAQLDRENDERLAQEEKTK